jgi:membrane fusion protein, multidrug efflux system
MNEALKPDDVTRRSAPATVETAPSRRRSLFARIAIVAALAAAAVFGWQKFEHSEPSTNEEQNSGRPAQPPQTVRVAAATLGDMPLTIDALGTVTPFETVTVKTQIAGNLQTVGFTEGQIVKAGDFLAQIDPRPYEAALAQAQGQLAKDTALLGQAQSDLARYQQLAKQDSISQQQVADQIALVAQDKAAIATDQAMVKTAELNVAYTHIVSPVTGRVGLRLVDPGNYLQPSDTTGIVVITQIDPISVVFTTPEDNLPRISARLNSGAELKVTVLDRDNVHALATGTLTTYDSQIDVTTGTIRMRATFANPNAILFPQQFVNVRLLVDTMTGATLAPNAAIQLGASGNFVYLLNDDSTVSKRDIVTGPGDGKRTVITSGLKAGDKVVIDGVDRLRDGAKVKVVDSPASPGAQAAGGEGLEQGAGGPEAGSADGAGQHHRHHEGGQGAGAADPRAAEACAAGLPAEAKAIYQAAAPEFASSADPRALVKSKTVDLVKAGTVQRDSAHASAVAAGGCLEQLSSAGGPQSATPAPAPGASPAASSSAPAPGAPQPQPNSASTRGAAQ